MTPFVPCLFLASLTFVSGDIDTDRDGLCDFHELHKHFTDPRKADSDGDGIPDGDWLERREFAYAVRAVVQVMKPVTLEHLTDDFQDARLLDESDTHAELEVILYPFGTAHEQLAADDGWRKPARELKPWLEPGPTSDWTPELRKRLTADLEADGIDLEKLSDREAVEKVSDWLMHRAEYHDGFSTFITAFDEHGRPNVPAELQGSVEANASRGLSLEEQWAREISASGMYQHKTRGSCTSSAIYLSGCLRAAGIPTRTVLCIPLIDANDERERELLALGLTQPRVRAIATAAAQSGIGSWTSHTFNEVWVGGRWRRLNYSRLGQPILDRELLGLMIHVATFRDWADARMPETVGRRHELNRFYDLFGGPNPYSTIALRDQIGVHCKDLPGSGVNNLLIEALHWTDDAVLPGDIVAGCSEQGRFGLIAVFRNLGGFEEMSEFLARADPTITLEAEGRATIPARLDARFMWHKNDTLYVYVPFGSVERDFLARGVEYRARANNANAGFTLALELDVTRR